MKFINHYIEKKNYINEFVPTPLGPPHPPLHIVSLCALLNKFLKKKYKGTLSLLVKMDACYSSLK